MLGLAMNPIGCCRSVRANDFVQQAVALTPIFKCLAMFSVKDISMREAETKIRKTTAFVMFYF